MYDLKGFGKWIKKSGLTQFVRNKQAEYGLNEFCPDDRRIDEYHINVYEPLYKAFKENKHCSVCHSYFYNNADCCIPF